MIAVPVPVGLSNVVAISAGTSEALALKRDGTIEKWGVHYLSPPAGLSNVVAIAMAGNDFADDLAVIKDGKSYPLAHPL